MKRRQFLGQALGVTALLASGGCTTIKNLMDPGYVERRGKSMIGFRDRPLGKIRVGIIGVGIRGSAAVHRLCRLDDFEIRAISDLSAEKVNRQIKVITDLHQPKPVSFYGPEDNWKNLCDMENLDLVYICTPWLCHTPMAVYAMEAGKHVAVEVPAAVSVEQGWQLVEASEKSRKHCMMLENCCYGENELFGLNLCRKGLLGETVHGDSGYIRDLTLAKLKQEPIGANQGQWRLIWSQQHTGNPSPTHGLGPVCQYMNINRGDRMIRLASMSSDAYGLKREAERLFGKNSPQASSSYRQGDINTTLIRTYRGKTIMLQHDTTSPRPLSRFTLISGTKGIFATDPLRIALQKSAHKWMDENEIRELKERYAHPLWKKLGEIAQKTGLPADMDLLMDYRLGYCLKRGLPLDMDVYDAASWSSLVELTESSVLRGGVPLKIPDFTRSGWKVSEPFNFMEIE